jgi:hypothetical protein
VAIEFTATPSLYPGRIDLRWRWSSTNASRPDFRVARGREEPPAAIGTGLVVLHLSEWFRPAPASTPWGRVERHRVVIDSSAAEGGLEQAAFELYFDGPTDVEPVRVTIHIYDAVAGTMQTTDFPDVTRVVRTQVQLLATDPVTYSWQILHTPGGMAEVPAGTLSWTITTPPTGAPAGETFTWTPDGGTSQQVGFERFEQRIVRFDNLASISGPVFVLVQGTDTASFLTLLETMNVDSGEFFWDVRLTDDGIPTSGVRYYTLFVPDPSQPSGLQTATAMALAASDFGSPARLYELLPPYHRYADEPDPAARDKGQLRRFLVPFGLAADAARSSGEDLRNQVDPDAARLDLLPHLARQIGWEADVAATGLQQRHDVRYAPALFSTVGTPTNLATLVNRVLGWPHRVKEFVNNIFLTNAPEAESLWELWESRYSGGTWTKSTPVTVTTSVDAHPAAALDGATTLWLFWHSDRNGRREIWRQRLGGVDPAPQLARTGAPDDTPGFSAVEESPSAVWAANEVWVFWSSDRSGRWEIWTRTFSGGAVGSTPLQLTDHPAPDRHPAALYDPAGTGRIWLFWDSSRRGPTDIWSRGYDIATQVWGQAERLTQSPFRDENPAAAIDPSGTLWLFWTRDVAGRRELWYRTRVGNIWQPETRLTTGEFRDESPAALPWGTGLLLLWHSNRNGFWQIWGRRYESGAWHPETLLDSGVQGDKEPSGVVYTGGGVRVFWRSQRRAEWYRSRTIDTGDTEMLDAMGTDTDHAHYTHVTNTTSQDLYARSVVGVYLTPDTTLAPQIQSAVDRLGAFVEPFRPLQARYVWITDQPAHTETIAPDPDLGEEWVDAVL